MKLTVKEIASLLNATYNADPAIIITGIAPLKDAGENDMSFLYRRQYLKDAKNTQAGIIVTKPEMKDQFENAIFVDQPEMAFRKMLTLLESEKIYTGFHKIHPSATIHPDTQISKNVSIGPQTVIDQGVHIGENTQIGAGCYIGVDTQIGNDL